MHNLLGAVCRRTAGVAAGVILTGGLAGGVLLATAGTAFADPSPVSTSTQITGTSQNGATLNVGVQVTASTAWPSGTVKVSAGWGSCYATLSEQGSNPVGVGNCNIPNLQGGNYTLTAYYEGSPGFSPSGTSEQVTLNSGPVFNADSPPHTATNGQNYSYTFHAYGNPAPTYALSGAPGWLNINPNTGTVWGTVPSWVNSFSYSVVASNGVGSPATAGPYTVWVRHPQANVNINTYLSCPSKVHTGQKSTCTLYVTNRGWSSASNVTAQIALPWQLHADYCGYYNYGCISSNTASENLGTLYPGQTQELTVTFTARSGFSLFGWHPGHRFTVKVVGSASSNWNWWFSGQRTSYSDAWVTIIPRGFWW